MFTVEKIEKNYIILEDRNTTKLFDINKDCLPSNIKEGDILDLVNNKYIINTKLTRTNKKNIKDKFNSLMN